MARLNLRSAQWRLTRSLIAVAMCGATSINAATLVTAQPVNPDDASIAEAENNANAGAANVAQLANTLSTTQEEIGRLENDMGRLREAVNKALVDLHDAQATAERARQDARAARTELDNVQAEMSEAQKRLDEFSRSAYRHGATNPAIGGVAGNSNSDDALDRQTYLRTNIEKQRALLDRLDHLRTEKANKESQLREAKKVAEQREATAQQAQTAAQQAINENSRQLQEHGATLAQLTRQRDDAQQKLDAARGTVNTLNNQRKEYEEYEKARQERDRAAAEAAAAEQARQEAVRKQQEAQARQQAEDVARADAEAEAATDNAEAAEEKHEDANAAAQAAAEALVASAQPEHTRLDSPYPTDLDDDDAEIAALQAPQPEQQTEADDASGSAGLSTDSSQVETLSSLSDSASASFSGSREEKIEAVIARAQSQIGVPYAWGGGNATGPTQGIRDGGIADSFGDYNKVGFDCSGLVVYAFAGIGIALPHYTGYQYQHGTRVSPNELQRGDLIFYGPNAEDHVAIYLGDGQMLEAPQSGSEVQISPVRWSGMSPYAVRLI